MSEKDSVDAGTIQFLYSLWDATLPGRDRVLAWKIVPENEESIPRAEIVNIQLLLRYFNRIGHLVEREILPKDFVEEFFGREILRSCARLVKLLASARQGRDDPNYLEFIDRLADRCKKRWPNYVPKYYPKAPGTMGLRSGAT